MIYLIASILFVISTLAQAQTEKYISKKNSPRILIINNNTSSPHIKPNQPIQISLPSQTIPQPTTIIKPLTNSRINLNSGLYLMGGIVGLYASLLVLYLRYSYFLKFGHGWSSFQDHIPLSQLQTLSNELIINELLKHITKKYAVQPTQPITTAVLLFNKDIDKEIALLQNSFTFYHWLHRMKIFHLFPYFNNLFWQAQTSLERALFLKKISLTWLENQVAFNENKL